MKKLVSAFVTIFVFSFAYAQTPSPDYAYLEDELGEVFEYMDLSLVQTGILQDRGINIVEFNPYNGQNINNANKVDYSTFRHLMRGVESSTVGDPMALNDLLMTQNLSEAFHTGINPIGIMLYQYNRIKSTATTQNLITINNKHIYYNYDHNNNWIDPYESDYLFAFSPYMNICGNSVTYQISTSSISSNLSFSSLEFDPGNGTFQAVTSNTQNFTIYYTNDGTYELRLKVNFTDNTSLIAHSTVFVYNASSANSPGSHNVEMTFTSSCSYEGFQPSAKVRVKYRSGYSSLTRPLIFAEGFDPLNIPVIRSIKYGGTTLGDCILDWSDIDYSEYDLIYVDWMESAAPIEANADILKQVIFWVNANKPHNKRSILIGHSMGGLISRYTLRSLEIAGTPHHVSKYISIDTPHSGVNVPLGAVYAAQHLYNYLDYHIIDKLISLIAVISGQDFTVLYPTIITPFINQIMRLNEAPSVREMLINYVNPNFIIDNSKHISFQNTLNQMGLPQGDVGMPIKNICVSYGGVNDFTIYNNYLYFNAALSAPSIVSLLLGGLTINIPPTLYSFFSSLFEPYAANLFLRISPHTALNSDIFELSGGYTKHFAFAFHLDELEYCNYHYTAGVPVHLDDAYGSYYNAGSIPHKPWSPLEYNPGRLSSILSHYFTLHADYEVNGKFMFVPTVSSLYYKKGENLTQTDYLTDFTNIDNYCMNDLPFDKYYIKHSASYHAGYLNNNTFHNAILDLNIDGPASVCLGSQFSVSDSSLNVSWKTSDDSIAEISSAGIITDIKGVGDLYIIATVSFSDGDVVLRKKVNSSAPDFTGFPGFQLTQTCLNITADPPFAYRIVISPTSTVDPRIANQFIYHWGTKSSHSSSITYTTSSNPFFTYIRHNSSAPKQVFCFVEYNGQYSITRSITCEDPLPSIIIDSAGNIYSLNEDTPFIRVKSDMGDSYECECFGHTMYFDHFPSSSEVCKELLLYDDFVQELKKMKPWGDETSMIFEFKAKSNKDNYNCNHLLKFFYEKDSVLY